MDPIEPTDQYELVTVSDPDLSPDEDNVAYVRKDPVSPDEYTSSVVVATTDEREHNRLTPDGANDLEPRWSPTGDSLAIRRIPEDDHRSQVWIVDPDDGDARQLTSVPGGVGSLVWSPNGAKIAFLQDSLDEEREDGTDVAVDSDYEEPEPNPRVFRERLIHREERGRHPTRTWKTWYDRTRTNVYVADVASGEVERVSAGEFDCFSLDWGDSKTIYYTQKRSDDEIDHQLIAADLTNGSRETIAKYHHSKIWTPAVSATPDGQVAFTSMTATQPTSHQTNIEVLTRDTGERTTVTAELDRTISRNTTPQWDRNGIHLYFLALDEGSVVMHRNTVSETVTEPVLGGDHGIAGPLTRSDISISDGRVAYVQASGTHIGDVVVAPIDGGESGDETQITRANETLLKQRTVSEPEEYWYDAADGSSEIQSWLVYPPDFDHAETYPLVVAIHGGPHAMYSASSQWLEFQSLAANGYVVFWPNYRGSTGYGEAFMHANAEDWGGVDLDDIMAGADNLTSREYIDEDNMFVTGGSYGGYLTGWCVTQTDRFAAAVPKSGLYCLPGVYGVTDKFKFMEGGFGTTPLDNPDIFWERSPVAHANEVTTPTRIIVGEEDYATPLSDSQVFHHYLRKAGVEAELVSYPDVGHEILRDGTAPKQAVDRTERTIEWFDRHSTAD